VPRCKRIAALRLDEAVLEHVFTALRDLTPEVLTTAIRQSEEDIRCRGEQFRRELEQAEERACVAEERYKNTPLRDTHVRNRLSAEWNAALEDLQHLPSRHAQATLPPALPADDVNELARIATRLALLWNGLTNEDKKRVIRLVVRRVIYRKHDDIYGEVTIEWEVGPPTIQLFVPSGNVPRLVRVLFDAGQAPEEIASALNAQRVRPAARIRARVFDAKIVRRLLWTEFGIRVAASSQMATATILELSAQGLGQTAIAKELAGRGIVNSLGRPYTPDAVGSMIRTRRSRRGRPSEAASKSDDLGRMTGAPIPGALGSSPPAHCNADA
jgi:hypothetical protein